ncbi:hypothetical protein CC2G_002081 [Coprinopsis cinerea AmutBmut pab1-1]|nr:hypothetical protein CC2G_002081 [Coprinopsis cinerea AmutBmut pab1-1]
MDSSSRRIQQEQQRKEELQRQIEKLQAELSSLPEGEIVAAPKSSPKRKKSEPTILAPATPSPRKKRKVEQVPKGGPIAKPLFQPASKLNTSSTRRPEASKSKNVNPPILQRPKPSNLLQKLAQVKSEPEAEESEPVNRTTSFDDRPEPPPEAGPSSVGAKRDERLMLVDDFEMGPYEFTPPLDDPHFEKLEPHSNIALISRNLSHADFSEHLEGRYYISPSRLYSSIRLLPDKQGYDIPVPGDWVTIAVVAERSPVRYTKAPVTLGPDEDAIDPKSKWKAAKKEAAAEGPKKPHGKQFVNMKLIDFGARTKSSATGGKAVVRGDAFLSLLLFQADSVETIEHVDGTKEKMYRGGSKGAFEMLDKLRPGDVVALLNPKILKPYQKSADKPHPVDNILAVTPESASSVAILGKARDLGQCGVRKKDGKTCGGWCDKRVSEVCEYHVQTAIQHRRAARPEFTAGTGGMTSKPIAKRKTEFDPARQWGLLPENKPDGATYIVSGHIVGGGDSRSMFVGENMGREGQAKAKRKMANAEADKLLKQLAERDREGMEAVMAARAAASGSRGKDKGKGKDKDGEEGEEKGEKQRKQYSVSIVRSLGFDPTVKAGHRRIETGGESKFEELQALSAKRKIALGRAPKKEVAKPSAPPVEERTVDLDESDGEEGMIDLDDI